MNVKEYIEERAVLDSDEHVVIKEMWDGNHRVNIWRYDPNRIVRSYFVTVTESGIISHMSSFNEIHTYPETSG